MLGQAKTESGVASVQFIPQASKPVVERAVRTEIERNDGTTSDGTAIIGSGFSVGCAVYVDSALLPDSVEKEVSNSTKIYVAQSLPLGAEVVVMNPAGAQSAPVLVTDE